jgi:hypothetical protein
MILVVDIEDVTDISISVDVGAAFPGRKGKI